MGPGPTGKLVGWPRLPHPFGPGQTFCGALGQWERGDQPPTGGADRKPRRTISPTPFSPGCCTPCLVDADHLDTETFMNGFPAPRAVLCFHRGIAVPAGAVHRPMVGEPDTDLNRRRCAILRQCLTGGSQWERGLYTPSPCPPGGGKTVSSPGLCLIHGQSPGMSRVVYVIPYTSIVDQTATVFPNPGEENVLEHHSGADYAVEEGVPLPR